METDTIAAIATAAGNSGISIIRISGDDAISIADQVFVSKSGMMLSDAASHSMHYGIVRKEQEVIDEAMAVVMRAPKSYTKENTVEIDCHGGMFVTKKVLEAVIGAGARPAEPGEFTKRAFLNGRIDLSEAEAVMDVIRAQNEFALKSAVNQLKGSVSHMIRSVRGDILQEIAYIEAVLDDPEHMSFENYDEELTDKLEGFLDQTEKILRSFENGRMLTEGIKTVILGKPNAGKSSVLNVLLGEERAIVTDIAGTTRDALEETMTLEGLTLRIIDTAGIRKSEDKVEKIGIERAKAYAKDADLVLFVADASTALGDEDDEILKLLEDKKTIVLLNKSDLPPVTTADEIRKLCDYPILSVSAKEKTGVQELGKLLKNLFFKGEISFNDQVYITNIRQKTAIEEAKKSLELVLESINAHVPEDFYTIDLMKAYEEFGKVIGEAVGEDLINEIFGKFCMGK